MPQPAPAPQDNPKITVDSNGAFTPSTGVVINQGGVVQFDVNYPTGMNACSIPFGTITFSYEPGNGGSTIKVG